MVGIGAQEVFHQKCEPESLRFLAWHHRPRVVDLRQQRASLAVGQKTVVPNSMRGDPHVFPQESHDGVRSQVMTFLKLVPALFFYLLSYSSAYAYEGRVHVNGSIIDSACSIDVDSREQSIDMGIIPLSVIRQSGRGLDKNVSINLINCMVNEYKHFKITFDGDAEGDLFGVRGDASGVGLQISDNKGIIFPGKAISLRGYFHDDSTLKYSLRLMANSHVLKAGMYSSSVRFKLDYF